MLIFVWNISLIKNRTTSDETTLCVWGTGDGLGLTWSKNDERWYGDGQDASSSSEYYIAPTSCCWGWIRMYWRWWTGCILSLPPGMNWNPTPSRASSPTRPISNWMRFKDRTLWPSGETAVTGYGSGQSLGSIMGRVLIFSMDILLPTACALPPAAVRLSELLMSPFPGGCVQRSCRK